MKILPRLALLGPLPLILGLLAGCNLLPQPQADSVRYFTLSGPAAVPPVAEGTEVRPVQLAGHLRNRALAVRVAANEVVYLEDARWAEPLDHAITQLLRARLGAVAGGASVSVQIQRCELDRAEGNRVQVAATYSIAPAEGGRALTLRGAFTASPRKWDGKDYGTLVDQLQAAVGELGEAIAVAVGTPPEKK